MKKTLNLRNVKIKQTEICLLIGLVTAIFCCFFNLFNETKNLSSKILRLHIIANSDSCADQELKIKLKNSLLQNFNFDECSGNVELAKKEIYKKLNSIETYSEKFIKSQGFPYSVKAKLEKSPFSTRCYEGFALPAANYEALKIEIGNAKGHNWWCVFVPAMCVPAAKTKQKLKKVLNNEQSNLIEKGCKTEIRFATLEFCEKIKNKFKNKT